MKTSKRNPHIYRYLLIFIASFCLINPSFSQQLNYDQIFEDLDRLTHEQAFSRLTRYQSQDPYFANTYLQLGYLSEQVFRDMDPLRDIDEVKHWVNNALIFYPMFSVYLQSGEFRRNREYYENISIPYSGRRLEEEDVLAFIEERIEFCKNYLENSTEVFATLERSKDHYNNCVRIFNEINDTYDNLNEVLLQTDETFLRLLSELEGEFQATIREFEQYRTLIRAFPISGYNQRYTLRPIKTFRLDGLTNSDFLEENFYLWDYGSWIRQFKNIYNDDILSLRNEIERIQSEFDQNRRFVLSMKLAFSELELDTYGSHFFYRLGKYDNNSLVRELFRYLDARQDYLMMSRNMLSNPDDSLALLMNRKLRFYHRLAIQHNQTEYMLNEFRNAVDERRVVRFNQFFNDHYGGIDGLFTFHQNELAFLDQVFDERIGFLKHYFENEERLRNSLGAARGSRGVSVPLAPVAPEVRARGDLNFVTLDVYYDQGDPLYAAGYHRQTGGRRMPFVAKVSDNKEVEWLRELPATLSEQAESGGSVEKIFPFGDGVMALTASGYTQDVFVADEYGINYEQTIQQRFYENHLVRLDTNGSIIFQKPLEERKKPLYLNYDEINQISIMAFGRELPGETGVYADITICKADSTGTVLWSTTLNIKGHPVAVVRTEDSYLAIFNFHEYNIAGEQRVSGNQGRDSALLLAELSTSGTPRNTTAVIGQESLYIDRIFNISSDEINLLGYSGLPGNRRGDLKYFIVSSRSDILYHNLR